MKNKRYKCVFNHELLILGSTQSPYQSYEDNITDAQAIGYVKELENTDVDVIMCCPTAWRRNLWHSEVDRHWQDEAPIIKEPLPEHDWTYAEKLYFRLRRYMLTGADPFGVSVKTAHEISRDIYASYRMNDNHYAWLSDCPTHNTIFKEHNEWKLKSGPDYWSGKNCFNYKYEGVRKYYYSILRELVEKYDVDGLELDFMRHSAYFEPEEALQCIPIMTEFVRSLRDMLDEFSKKRNKRLGLCVRIPHVFKQCKELGLDVEEWDKQGLIDMVNISSHFTTTPFLEIEEFKKHINNSYLYGEIHFNLKAGRLDGTYPGLGMRKANKEVYRTLAYNFMTRGCDGISLFNFDFVRDHHFHEPRLDGIYGVEPPFEALQDLSMETLKREPKHYYVSSIYNDISYRENYAAVKLNISDDTKSGIFKKAIVRAETNEKCLHLDIKMSLNGQELNKTKWVGELFVPLTFEVLPYFDHVCYFEVPLELIQQGENVFEIRNATKIKANVKNVRFTDLEVALYTDKPLWE